MPKIIRSLMISLACGACASCSPSGAIDSPINLTDDATYQTEAPNRAGIGKFYLGREISHVMGHLGAAWLERESRQTAERTDLLIANLPLKNDSVVADIGAGTGYFSFPIAAQVPQGRVLAVDIQQEMLEIIAKRKVSTGIDNVVGILGDITDPKLPAQTVDLAFVVDAYHECSHPLEMGQGIYAALKPGGKFVLIEYRGEVVPPLLTSYRSGLCG